MSVPELKDELAAEAAQQDVARQVRAFALDRRDLLNGRPRGQHAAEIFFVNLIE